MLTSKTTSKWTTQLLFVLALLPGIAQAQQPDEPAASDTPPVAFDIAFEVDSSDTELRMLAKTGNVDAAAAAESASATQYKSDYSTKLSYSVSQICVTGGKFSVTVYYTISGGKQVKASSKSWSYLAVGTKVTGSLTVYGGPGESVSFKVVRRAQGGLCDNTKTLTATGKTSGLKAPTNLRLSTSGSDKFVTLTFNKGTDIAPKHPSTGNYQFGYYIYRNGAFVGSTTSTASSNISYTASTTPNSNDEWGVATRFYGYTTNPAKTSSTTKGSITTTVYKKPTNFIASDDTTIGYVRLSWGAPSDYATHTNLYRDSKLIATLPKATTGYLDTGAQPGVAYTYEAGAYNSSSQLESERASDAGRAFLFSAADGSQVDRVKIQWTNFSDPDFAAEVKLSRDGDELGVFTASQSSYDDKDAQPGKLHRYQITALDENRKPVLSHYDYGFLPANGQVRGTVKTPGATTGGGVQDVQVSAWPTIDTLSSALSLDGADDFMSVRHTPNLSLSGNMTIEFWTKMDVTNTIGVFVNKRINGDNGTLNYQIQNAADGSFRFYTGGTGNRAKSSTVAAQGQWYHVAGVQDADSGKIRLFINGVLEEEVPLSAADLSNEGPLLIGRDEAARSVDGEIDEIRLWRIARSDSAINADMHRILKGDEAGLVAYWPFNENRGTMAGDYAKNGGHHGELLGNPAWADNKAGLRYSARSDDRGEGAYKIEGIYYNDENEFAIAPFKAGHGFDKPDTLYRFLENVPPDGWIANANFIDTTSFSISGKISFFSKPSCGVADVQILIDGKVAGVSDSSGNFSVSVPQAGNYTLKPALGNHTFEPAELALEVTGNVGGIVFLDQKTVTISGIVAGGCTNFIGTGEITIHSLDPDGCFQRKISTDSNGNYSLTLPAQKYAIELTGIANADNSTILSYFKKDTLDLTLGDSSFDYIYHSPPKIRINGPYAVGCDDFAGVPIMRQFRTDTLRIEVYEEYSYNGQIATCPVDSGTIVIDDRIADGASAKTLALANGEAKYAVTPGVPNILLDNAAHPYQKWLKVTANVERYAETDTLWSLVTGHKPRPGEPFSTTSPQLPIMILRDPPGDQSYSYLEKETSEYLNVGLSFGVDASLTVFSNAKVGGGFDIPFVGSGGAYAKLSKSLEVGASVETEATVGLEIVNRERLNTSDSEQITGARGDVYIGGALNIKYGITDQLTYSNCGVALDEKLVWGGDGFATRYMYTESYIRENLIPELQYLADNSETSDKAVRFLDAIEVWQQVLAMNVKLKQDAPIVRQNISFSGNLGAEESETVTQSLSAGIEFNLYIEQTVATSAGVTVGDFNEAEAGVKVRAKLQVGASLDAGISTANTIGYYLGDDDSGDDFTVNLKGDPVYGTPIFDLIGGTSSNPWEGLPSQPRDGLLLFVDPAQQVDVQPADPAIFKLRLFNTSPTNETREYLLSLIQASNPGGASVRSGNQFIDKLRYTIPAQDFQEVTVDVSRLTGHPYEYDNLQIRLFAEHDPQFADTVSFSAKFIKPCSEILLVQPASGWNINQVSSDKVKFVLSDYDASDPNLSALKLQYSEDGQSWLDITSFARASLPADTLRYAWDASQRPNGRYEVRAVAICSQGENYSIAASGFIDRSAWALDLDLTDAAGAGNRAGLTIGQSSMASDGLDPLIGESELPPSPPAGVFYAGFDLPTQPISASLADYRGSSAQNATWDLRFQPGAGGYPLQLEWDPAALPAGEFFLRDAITGDIIDINMKAQSSYMLDNSAITSLRIEFVSSYLCQTVAVSAGWNMISVPLESNDMFKNTIFPQASSQAFSFAKGYVENDLLRSGEGYWLKFDAPDTIEICGRQAAPLQIEVQAGWNMIGPFDEDTPISALTTTPAGIITSQFFGYENGYVVANTLQSGKGYWVQVSQNGLLNVNSNNTVTKRTGSTIANHVAASSSWGKIIITDAANNRAVLYAVDGDADLSGFSLPPAPLGGIFDARFGSDSYAAKLQGDLQEIKLSGAVYPVTVRVEGIDVRIQDNLTGSLVSDHLASNSTIELTDARVTSLSLVAEALPEQFELLQNYPNPFNPNTVIRFQLPENSHVKLTVYNLLGEVVAELADEEWKAGSHEITFDASRFATGVYFCRLQADNKFTAIKKMLLTK